MTYGARSLRAQIALVVAASVLLTLLTSACLSWPSGACDEYDQGHRYDTSSCTSDGKLATKKTVGCSDPGGPVYETTTTACAAGEVCGGEDRYASCRRPCATNADCLAPRPFCTTGYCWAGNPLGEVCNDDELPCASGLACLRRDTDASTSGDASVPNDGTAGAPPCGKVFANLHECRCSAQDL